uniref:Amidohydrolase-related domain-containing protein n=2 Tax=Ditylum brightwellii TaxID=49249 RepID=A0A7S4R5P2_9STRA
MSSPKKNDGIVIVTLAPERPGAISLIKELSNQNVVVAMGHTDATLAEGIEGVTSGATLITHLFNAMNPFHHREPGMLGMLMLDDDDGSDGNDESHNSVSTNKNENGPVTSDRNISKHRPYFSLIVDGIHSHPSAVKLAHRLHPNGCVLVTDAMSAMGLGDGTHTLGTMKVDIKGNRATVSGTNTLAGSVVSMDSCVKSYRKFTKCSVGEAIRAATLHPAKVLGIDNRKGRICAGYDADLTLLGVDELDVMGTWVGGKKEFDNISSAVCFGGSKKRKIEQS